MTTVELAEVAGLSFPRRTYTSVAFGLQIVAYTRVYGDVEEARIRCELVRATEVVVVADSICVAVYAFACTCENVENAAIARAAMSTIPARSEKR